MTCPKCGREIPYGAVCPCSGEGAGPSGSPAQNLIKKLGSSPMFLAAAIFVLFSLVLNISAAVLYVFLPNYAMSAPVSGPSSPNFTMSFQGNIAFPVSAFVMSIPAILACIGMWLFLVSCRRNQSDRISTAGLTLCKGVYIAFLVLIGVLVLLFAAVLVFTVTSGVFTQSEASPFFASPALLAIWVIMEVILLSSMLALPIAFTISVIRTVNRVKECLRTGMPVQRVSGFLTGMLWVVGIFAGFFGVIMTFFSFIMINMSTLPGGPPVIYTVAIILSGVSFLAEAVRVILIAVLLGRLRREMNYLIFATGRPYPIQPAGQPMYQGAPGQPFYQSVPGQPMPQAQYIPQAPQVPPAQYIPPVQPVPMAYPPQQVPFAPPAPSAEVPAAPEIPAVPVEPAPAEPPTDDKPEEQK